MNKIERAILNRVKAVAAEYVLEEIEKLQKTIATKAAEKCYFDVMNSGILLDVNKAKIHGLNFLEKQVKKRIGKPSKQRESREETETKTRRNTDEKL